MRFLFGLIIITALTTNSLNASDRRPRQHLRQCPMKSLIATDDLRTIKIQIMDWLEPFSVHTRIQKLHQLLAWAIAEHVVIISITCEQLLEKMHKEMEIAESKNCGAKLMLSYLHW